MRNIIYCEECDEELTVISKTNQSVSFCPLCGSPIEDYDEDEIGDNDEYDPYGDSEFDE